MSEHIVSPHEACWPAVHAASWPATGRSLYLLDPAVADFAATSGATDLTGLDALMSYVRSEGLLGNFRIYPMKSAQNAGSGSTVHGLGGITANNMTLIGSPAWATDGFDLNGSTQFGKITDFIGEATLTVGVRSIVKTVAGAGTRAIASQFGSAVSGRSWYIGNNTDDARITLFRSSDGGGTNQERYDGSDSLFEEVDACTVAQWVDGGGRSLWADKTSVSVILDTGSPQTYRADSASDIVVGASYDGIAFSGINTLHDLSAFWLVTGTLTTTQREQITDFVNAL